MKLALRSAALIFLALASCGPERRNPTPGQGHLPVEGGRIFYRVAGTGPGTPVILLHGGPGGTAHYLEPLLALGDDRPVILYDQLGSGRSDRVTDTTLFRADRYVRELDSLRRALRIDRIHLYGHSWGSMLALEYLATEPEGIGSVILASPVVTARAWEEDGMALLATLPDSIRETIARHEAAGTIDSPEYQAAYGVFTAKYVSGMEPPMPPEIDSTYAGFNWLVYRTMWGPSEFSPRGSLRHFDRSAVLPRLDVPVLFTAGRHDEARPETVARFAAMTPGAEVKIFEQSAHMTMNSEPEAYLAAVREFLRRADERK